MERTPYCEILEEAGGKFVEFAGFYMPVQFDGILAEHRAVRDGVGLFDVSHMGEFLFEGETARKTLDELLCNRFDNLPVGKVRYSPMLNADGGVVDDVLVYCVSEKKFQMCVNAANKDKDKKWIEQHLAEGTKFNDVSDQTAQLAIQGPSAVKVIEKLFAKKDIPEKNYTFTVVDGLLNEAVILSRTGYTAEDGFEIYCDVNDARALFEKVMDAGRGYGLKLCGLGARDTLRLEGAMPLYGHEMSDDTLATEIGLDAFIKTDKPTFVGKTALLKLKPLKKRIGLKLIDRGIAREHTPVYADGRLIGEVTSGTHSPTLNVAIAMARVDIDFGGETVEVDVRGKRLKAAVVALPFYKRAK